MEEATRSLLSPSPEMEDVEKLMRASDLTYRAATLVGHANNLAWLTRRLSMAETPFLAAAAASVEEAATALSVSGVNGRTRAAGALLRACVKVIVAAEEAGMQQLLEAAMDVVDEAADVMRLSSEYTSALAHQPRCGCCGWLRRLGSWCVARTPRRATSGELQVDAVGFALSGAISLLPYIGRAGVLHDTNAFTDAYLWWIGVLFSFVWGGLAVGFLAQEGGQRFRLIVQFGRFCHHAATLGVTILVFFFCSWTLTPMSTKFLAAVCVGFALAHGLLWFESFTRGRT